MKRRPSCFSTEDNSEDDSSTLAPVLKKNIPSMELNPIVNEAIYLYDEVYDEFSSDLSTKQSKSDQTPKFAHKFMARAQERKEKQELIKQKQIIRSRSERLGHQLEESSEPTMKFETVGFCEYKNKNPENLQSVKLVHDKVKQAGEVIDNKLIKESSHLLNSSEKNTETVKSEPTSKDIILALNLILSRKDQKYLEDQLELIDSMKYSEQFKSNYLEKVKFLTTTELTSTDIEKARHNFLKRKEEIHISI